MTKEEFRKILPLYLGTECITNKGLATFCACSIHGNEDQWILVVYPFMSFSESCKLVDFKLLLRPIDDMTEEEADEWEEFCEFKATLSPSWNDMAQGTLWAIGKGFDLFNLIGTEFAQDKTKTENK